MDLPSSAHDDLTRALESEGRGYLKGITENLRKQGVPLVEEQLFQGDPAGTIVDFARGMAGSLVAMTTHGRSGVGRWLLGSVTDRVVCQSGVPVLVIRAVEGSASQK
jgi:nucleotide-binding universal stress UspA family protein